MVGNNRTYHSFFYNSYNISYIFYWLHSGGGLAKHLRCVGIDDVVPHSKKPESRYITSCFDDKVGKKECDFKSTPTACLKGTFSYGHAYSAINSIGRYSLLHSSLY